MSISMLQRQPACSRGCVASVLLVSIFANAALPTSSRTQIAARDSLAAFLSRRAEQPWAIAAPVPAPAPAVPLSPAAALEPAVIAQAQANGGCASACKEANRIWAEAAKAEALRVELDVNRTRARFTAEAQKLSDEVAAQVSATGSADAENLRQSLDGAIEANANTLRQAVALRGQQVVAAERSRFDDMTRHQQELALAVQQGIVKHGYKIAAEVTPKEAEKAGESFKGFEKKIAGSFENISKAWNASYETSEEAAEEGWESWSKAHNALNDTWSNITGSFAKTNAAAAVAQGLGPDIRWINQAVRMQSDLQAAASAAAHSSSHEAVEAQYMADKVTKVVQGNSDALPKLEMMLDEAEEQAAEAKVAVASASSIESF